MEVSYVGEAKCQYYRRQTAASRMDPKCTS